MAGLPLAQPFALWRHKMNMPQNLTMEKLQGAVLQSISNRAALADRGEISLTQDLADLHASGMLAAVVEGTASGGNVIQGATLLRRIGRASLPVGRIVEGHANALRLIALYGSPAQMRNAADLCAQGTIYGVWGAEGKTPVTVTSRAKNNVVLAGAKQFCSGLGMVTRAVLPVQTDSGPLLVLVNVQDFSRADPSIWQVSGMRATASGRYDVTGVDAEILGQPGDYLREPHFEGGIWRYCALHCGGLEGLADAVRRHILARGQTIDPHQSTRMAHMTIHAQTARLWVNAASQAVESGYEVDAAVTQALLAREAVEQACVAGIALAERSLGTAAFDINSDADRIRRDLAFFMRQANLDGKLSVAARQILASPTAVGEMW